MEPEAGSASLEEASLLASFSAGHSPFARQGLLARAGPFALVAVVAEASLALPPGTRVGAAVLVSLVLLAAVALAFLLPWDRLPAWASVLVPLTCTGWALALTLAGGTVSGVGLVLLIPLIWSALFHRPWESACVVAAIVAAEIVVSVTQSAPNAVTIRRALLSAALGGLLAVATHGLRDRIRRSQQATARLEQQLAELRIVEDRDRLAAELQSSVIQRIFAAGLKLQGVLSLAPRADVRRRVESSVDDLDDAIRLLRQAIFGLETPAGRRRPATAGPATVRRPVAGTRDHIRRAGGRCPARRGKRPAARHAANGPRADQPGCPADIGRPAGRRRPDRRRDRNRPGPAPSRQRRARAGLLPSVRQGEPGRHRDRRRAGRGWHAAGLERAGSLRPASSRSTLSPLGAIRHRGPTRLKTAARPVSRRKSPFAAAKGSDFRAERRATLGTGVRDTTREPLLQRRVEGESS